MISNFLMCLGYVPNDGKEAVNFMILGECHGILFFSSCFAVEKCFLSLSAINVLCVWQNLPPWDGYTFYFSVIDARD